MEYRKDLERLSALSASEIEARLKTLLSHCPSAEWPFGMPGSLDPRLVMIGVSPGNSPDAGRGPLPSSCPGLTPPDNFYYEDTKGYWRKVREFSRAFLSRDDQEISEAEALLLTTHLNLGTGMAGTASKNAAEEGFVRWVSYLLQQQLRPDLVVLFGLNSIMTDSDISSWWNHAAGLPLDWQSPAHEVPMTSYTARQLKYREWHVQNATGKAFRVVIWPNHPSRSPFTNSAWWTASVAEYVDHYAAAS